MCVFLDRLRGGAAVRQGEYAQSDRSVNPPGFSGLTCLVFPPLPGWATFCRPFGAAPPLRSCTAPPRVFWCYSFRFPTLAGVGYVLPSLRGCTALRGFLGLLASFSRPAPGWATFCRPCGASPRLRASTPPLGFQDERMCSLLSAVHSCPVSSAVHCRLLFSVKCG